MSLVIYAAYVFVLHLWRSISAFLANYFIMREGIGHRASSALPYILDTDHPLHAAKTTLPKYEMAVTLSGTTISRGFLSDILSEACHHTCGKVYMAIAPFVVILRTITMEQEETLGNDERLGISEEFFDCCSSFC
jgi:hypothetical protein